MTKTAEIVTFRLIEGADAATFVNAARGMTPYLERTGAVVSRSLSVDPDGLWTDHIVWTSHAAAMEAAQNMPNRPEAAAFMAPIDPASVTMRHAALQLE